MGPRLYNCIKDDHMPTSDPVRSGPVGPGGRRVNQLYTTTVLYYVDAYVLQELWTVEFNAVRPDDE